MRALADQCFGHSCGVSHVDCNSQLRFVGHSSNHPFDRNWHQCEGVKLEVPTCEDDHLVIDDLAARISSMDHEHIDTMNGCVVHNKLSKWEGADQSCNDGEQLQDLGRYKIRCSEIKEADRSVQERKSMFATAESEVSPLDHTSQVQARVMQFQEKRARDKARTLTSIGHFAVYIGFLGFVLYVSASVTYFFVESRLLYYVLSVVGLVFFGSCLLLLSTCPMGNGYDADSMMDSNHYLRFSIATGSVLGSIFYSRVPPHLNLLGIIPSGMMFLRFSSVARPRLPFSTSLLQWMILNFILGLAGTYWHCYLQTLNDTLSEYCSEWDEGEAWSLVKASWATAGLVYGIAYCAWLRRSCIDSGDRTLVAWSILHISFVIHGVSWILNGVSKLAAGSIDHGSGASCVGLSWLMPATVIFAIGSSRCFKLATRMFEDLQADEDSAFMAMLLDDVVVTVGQEWWIRNKSGIDWSRGEVLLVNDREFTVRVVDSAQCSPEASARSGRPWAVQSLRKRRKLAFLPIQSFSFASSASSEQLGNYVDHVLPLAGRHLSALELLNFARENLRCVDWHALSLDLFNETTCGGRVKGDFSVSRPLKPNERIDIFLSHSWHDDPSHKWACLQQFADTFFQKHGRYPTFWLDKACIDQSNLADGLRVLPIYVMNCRKVLALVGETYALRLWCVWELFTVFAFAEENHAVRKVKLMPSCNGLEDDIFKSLFAFDSSLASCFDPNEENRLRRIIDTIGRERFDLCVQGLSKMCYEALQQGPSYMSYEHTEKKVAGGESPTLLRTSTFLW